MSSLFHKQSESSAPAMEYRALGKSGLRVSALCLGQNSTSALTLRAGLGRERGTDSVLVWLLVQAR